MSNMKVGTLLAFSANVSQGSFPNEKYVSIPIEGKQITGFFADKFIENNNNAVGVVLENPSKRSVRVFFNGEVSSNSGNVVTISTKWLRKNTKVVRQKGKKNE